jgi:hypothetical protein
MLLLLLAVLVVLAAAQVKEIRHRVALHLRRGKVTTAARGTPMLAEAGAVRVVWEQQALEIMAAMAARQHLILFLEPLRITQEAAARQDMLAAQTD